MRGATFAPATRTQFRATSHTTWWSDRTAAAWSTSSRQCAKTGRSWSAWRRLGLTGPRFLRDRPREVRRVPAETQRPVLPVAGVEDADPWRRDDAALRGAVVDHIEVGRGQRHAVQPAIDVERPADQAGTSAPPDAGAWLNRTDQHRLGHA